MLGGGGVTRTERHCIEFLSVKKRKKLPLFYESSALKYIIIPVNSWKLKEIYRTFFFFAPSILILYKVSRIRCGDVFKFTVVYCH